MDLPSVLKLQTNVMLKKLYRQRFVLDRQNLVSKKRPDAFKVRPIPLVRLVQSHCKID